MSIKNNKKSTEKHNRSENLHLSTIDCLLNEPEQKGITGFLERHWIKGAVGVVVLLLTFGVFAKKGWLPHTDPLSGKKTGWFGSTLPHNSSSTWNPFAQTTSTPTPQLSKEYIYAGSKLLAVADANANAAPPADLAIWRPLTGEWYIYNGESVSELPNAIAGQSGDIPVQGDYDGDGKTDFSYFRPSEGRTYIIRSSDNSAYTVDLGTQGDIPVPADYDGDGKTDIVFWKPTSADWKVIESSTTIARPPVSYGSNSDKPISGDFDGDGKADHAYWRSSTHSFHYVNSSDGQPHSVSLGSSSSSPVCSDYDGDGKTDFAVLTGNVWKILNSSTNTHDNITWYDAGDIPVPNDYDGDGKTDIAVWRFNTGTTATTHAYWCIRQSSDLSTRINMFGQPGDIPVPAFYRR